MPRCRMHRADCRCISRRRMDTRPSCRQLPLAQANFCCAAAHTTRLSPVSLSLLLDPSHNPPVSVNAVDHAGWSALHFACLGGFPEHESHTPVVALLLSRGADPHAPDVACMRPIHVCTDTSALRLLLQAGADPNACDEDGRTPLHMHGVHNCAALLDLPLEFSAPMRAQARDRWGRTALHLASEPDKCRLLVGVGFDKNARDEEGQVSDTGIAMMERGTRGCRLNLLSFCFSSLTDSARLCHSFGATRRRSLLAIDRCTREPAADGCCNSSSHNCCASLRIASLFCHVTEACACAFCDRFRVPTAYRFEVRAIAKY